MSMDKEAVCKVARLSQIRVSEEEIERISPQLTGILKWIEQLGEVNTDNVEPLANVVDSDLHLRKDEITDGNCSDKILANAPEEVQNFFVVPKVIE
ncbi:MAG: Asp-tRNA(Asn)/Glu-tRNA(Gln) amidotransferase subunit GatC [Alphaproteobacteria bacterium]|nr:Asp-tRNA(Asn)/Glu-tRNA(Gln) amidotransferase subunit GatC [Alphaproteobacteria bacterium]